MINADYVRGCSDSHGGARNLRRKSGTPTNRIALWYKNKEMADLIADWLKNQGYHVLTRTNLKHDTLYDAQGKQIRRNSSNIIELNYQSDCLRFAREIGSELLNRKKVFKEWLEGNSGRVAGSPSGGGK